MIAYFDTSAVVPLLVAEVGSLRAWRLWADADRVLSVRLVYPEGRAALAQAERLGRLTRHQLRAAVAALEARCDQLDIVEIDADLARSAGELAEQHALRGYDAVHLAAAVRIRQPDLVVVAGDVALLTAASVERIATAALVPSS